jgi:hypothetical protein
MDSAHRDVRKAESQAAARSRIAEDLQYATSRGSAKPTTIWIPTAAIDYVALLADMDAMIVSDNRQRHITACTTEEILCVSIKPAV